MVLIPPFFSSFSSFRGRRLSSLGISLCMWTRERCPGHTLISYTNQQKQDEVYVTSFTVQGSAANGYGYSTNLGKNNLNGHRARICSLDISLA